MELSVGKVDDLIKTYDDANGAWRFIKIDERFGKQLTIIEDTLSRLGLLKNETKLYFYLARIGEKKAAEIAEAVSP
jgi:hypothetical protein